MEEKGQSIIFVLYKYSIVVKGMERKLSDAGFLTEEIVGDFSKIMNYSSSAGGFVLYLPDDITEDAAKNRDLKGIFEQFNFCGKKVIIMGESEQQEFISINHPDYKDYKWVETPIDSDKFCNIVKEMVSGSGFISEKKKILIVDDDPSYAGMVRQWLKEKFQMSVVTGGMQAITFLAKNSVDLILLDYEMPVVNGPEVLQMIRKEPKTANIPVVFLTGVSAREGVSKVMELKPDGYILKSTTKEELEEYINNTLSL